MLHAPRYQVVSQGIPVTRIAARESQRAAPTCPYCHRNAEQGRRLIVQRWHLDCGHDVPKGASRRIAGSHNDSCLSPGWAIESDSRRRPPWHTNRPMSTDNRDRSLDEIRATYDAYGREGRASIWSLSNAGHRRLTEARDARLASLLVDSGAMSHGASLIDIGCGGGGLALLAARHRLPLAITGIDLLPERIEAARVSAPSATFVVGSADELPFGDASFDLASAITLFSSLPSLELERDAAREIGRVMRPGGWLIWFDIRYRNPWNSRVHGTSSRRLRALFPDWTAELYSIGVPPPIARRLGPLTPFAYPVLHAFQPLRSHLIGRLRKPT